jgi:Lrp/AsnC family transcriptional regulator for asnA, asnC and gidA
MVSKKDEEIIALIQSDARIPISEIARKVDLSENGVRYRIEKLERSGYITSYVTLLNPKKFGKKVMAIFHFNTKPSRTRSMIGELLKMDQLEAVYQTTGNFSIMAMGLFRDNEELNDFISKKFTQDSIVDFKYDVVIKKHKEGPFSI